MCSRDKCMRPGPITSNGYLNFLREYRKKKCGLTPVETVKCGAKAWNRLTCKQKAKYRLMGCNVRKRPRKKRGCRPKRKRRSCRPKRRRRSCPPKRKRRSCPPKRKRRSCRPKRRKPKCPRRRRRRPSCGKRKKCMKPGPLTNNPYLNFLRSFRRKHCGLTPHEAIQRGARKWCSMTPEQRARYQRQACKMSTSCRRKQTPICRAMRKRRRRC